MWYTKFKTRDVEVEKWFDSGLVFIFLLYIYMYACINVKNVKIFRENGVEKWVEA